MRIVIDLQACQTEGSHNRGIGRYSLALTQAIARQRGNYEVRLLLNELYSELSEKIKKQFDGILDSRMVSGYRYLPSKVFYGTEGDYHRQLAEVLICHHYAQLRPDILHISSVFEGCGGMAVVPGKLSALPGTVRSATLYDLIPLLMKEIYLPNEVLQKWYFQKLLIIRSCDLLLAISESTRKDAIHYLGITPERIVNISGAATPNFKVVDISPEMERAIRDQYGIEKRFVLYTGGIDHRKNLEGAISAFAKLPGEIRQQYQFVIVCSTYKQHKLALLEKAAREGLQEREVLFTGYVPEEDLVLLYNLCTVFIFPSRYEGFGLPVLEAMCCGAPVIGANNSSIPEIIGRKDALFDSERQSEITSALYRALTDEGFLRDLKTWSCNRAKEFRWEYSAAKALAAFEEVQERTRLREPVVTARYLQHRKMAYFSPIADPDNKIAQYARILLPFLARYYDIDIYTDRKPDGADSLRHAFPVFLYREFADHSSDYEIIIYNLEDILCPTQLYDILEEHPGIIVLHDSTMQGLGEFSREGDDFINREAVNSAITYYDRRPVFSMAVGIFIYSPRTPELLQQVYYHGLAAPFTCLTDMVSDTETSLEQEQISRKPIEVMAAEFALAVEKNLQQYLVQQQLVLVHELRETLADQKPSEEEIEMLVNCAVNTIPKF